ncbi:hypothetical protein ACQWU4_00120 [Chryseobacterium sp. MIQD13]|uniref:hypothetical protein n=1 Tax=Chryseobacterium sp. MIQD13 TaxID=3422310 RepID=UPI003D2C7593
MLADVNQFPTIQSKHSKIFTLFIKIFGITMSLVILVTAVSMIFLGGVTKIRLEIRILLAIIAILLIIFITWLLIIQFKNNSQKKVTHVIVDREGLHHYRNEELIKTINYNDLKTAPQNERYDVFFYNPPESEAYSDLCFYIYDEESKMAVRKAVFFEGDTVITNGKQLLAHFIKGIVLFRPDLRIDPNLFEIFKI